MTYLVEQFGQDEHTRHPQWLLQREWFIKARELNNHKEKVEEKAENRATDFGIGMVEATIAEIQLFEAKLDKYETATTAALLHNQEQLDEVKLRIASMLDQAYVMPDGRRVFKSEDGPWAIDEFGAQVSPDELAFEMIPDGMVSAESYAASLYELSVLESEREDLLDFQEKLDDARDQLEEGGMSADELDVLDAELLDIMPVTVRDQDSTLAPNPTESLSTNIASPQQSSSVTPEASALSSPQI